MSKHMISIAQSMSSQRILAAFLRFNNSTMIHMWKWQWWCIINVLTICVASSTSGSCPRISPWNINILRIENNLGSWHHIMASISWMQGYIIYQLMKSRSHYLIITYLVHLTFLLQIWHMANIATYLPWPTNLLTNIMQVQLLHQHGINQSPP